MGVLVLVLDGAATRTGVLEAIGPEHLNEFCEVHQRRAFVGQPVLRPHALDAAITAAEFFSDDFGEACHLIPGDALEVDKGLIILGKRNEVIEAGERQQRHLPNDFIRRYIITIQPET